MSHVRDVRPAGPLHGSVRVPGDKSASHRALLLSALADGVSTIEGLSPGLDVAATRAIVALLGAPSHFEGALVAVEGPARGLVASAEPLDCTNSGTTMRLLAGVASTVRGTHTLVGDASLSTRPMDRVAVPLRRMGAEVTGRGARLTAPLVIVGHPPLSPIDYAVPVPSAQVKSAVLLAGLGATGPTPVREAIATRTTTEDMLIEAGLVVTSVPEGAGRFVTVIPGRPQPVAWRIPGDPSQAAFFVVLGAVHADARIGVLDVDGAPERTGFLGVLVRMGAALEMTRDGPRLRILSQSSRLHATEITSREIPSVDEVPALVVAAAAAEGVTAFREMAELRLKESDRFTASIELASQLGCAAWSSGDDFFVEGLGSAALFRRFEIDARLDHRLVMASAVAGLAGAGCVVGGASTVASSYPGFFDDVASLQ